MRTKSRTRARIEQLENRRLLAAHVWSGAVSGNWSVAGNWASGGVPVAAESNLTLDFPANGVRTTTTNDITGLTIQAMTFEQAYSLSGDAFTLAGSITSSGSGSASIANNVTLGSNLTLNPVGQLNLSGNISGSYGITTNSGQPLMSGANTYNGATTIAGGTLALNAAHTVVPGNIEISGGIVDEQASATIASSAALTIDASGTLQLDSSVTQTVGSLAGSGIIDGSGTFTDGTTATDHFEGQLNGSVSLSVGTSTSWLILDGSTPGNTTGTITVSNGRLSLNGSLPSATLSLTHGELFGGGTVGTLNTPGGVMQPGPFNPGTLTVDGNIDLASGSEYAWVAVNDSTYAAFAATGNVTLGGSFYLANIGFGYTPAVGKAFTVVNNEGSQPVSGTFSGMPEGQVFQFNNADWKMSYVGGDGNDVTVTYLGLPTTVSLSTVSSSAAFGQATLHATVIPTTSSSTVPTGTVTFKQGTTVLGTTNVANTGVATFQAGSLAVGGYTITATYSGDTIFEASPASSGVSQTVTQAPTTTAVAASAGTIAAGGSITLTATITESDSLVAPTGSVTFSVNGTQLGASNLNNAGHATLPVSSLPAGADQITAVYGGDTEYQASTSPTPAGVTVVPTLSVGNVTMTEATSGTTNAAFTVTLSAASNEIVTVNYATTDGTAIAGTDYNATSGLLTFAPGATSKTINVPVIGSTAYKPTEAFHLTLTNPVSATIAAGAVTGTIQNTNDGMPKAGLVTDPFDLAETDLVVYGTAGSNNIQLKSTKIHGQVMVMVNKTLTGPFTPTGRVIVYGTGSNNKITADPRLTVRMILFGGPGSSTITAGSGNNILIGGAGKSTITDSAGMNLLIGGTGAAHLTGSRSGNAVVGGATTYDAGLFSNVYALESLLSQWASGGSYAARTAAMTSGVGILNANLGTAVSGLNAADHITGANTHDWVITSKLKHAAHPAPRHTLSAKRAR